MNFLCLISFFFNHPSLSPLSHLVALSLMVSFPHRAPFETFVIPFNPLPTLSSFVIFPPPTPISFNYPCYSSEHSTSHSPILLLYPLRSNTSFPDHSPFQHALLFSLLLSILHCHEENRNKSAHAELKRSGAGPKRPHNYLLNSYPHIAGKGTTEY